MDMEMSNRMNKKILISIIAAGIAALFVFQKPAFSGSQADCGDCLEKIELSKDNDFEIEDVTFNLKSRHGYNIRVRSVRPRFSKYPEKRFPTVLRIAGGWGVSTFLLNNRLAKKAASDGLIIVAFDTEPKLKEKTGSRIRDYNGFKDQDDAATVLASILNHPNVDPDMVGVWSHSNGITLASGVLGREKYKEIGEKIIFLLDDEGPHCPEDLIDAPDIKPHTRDIKSIWRNKVINAKVGAGKDYRTTDEFFSERCAVNFIGNFKGVYERVQAKNDHELAYYYGHAAAMINIAVNGKAKWTRLNREPKDQIYKSAELPGGIDMESVLDVEKIRGPNDRRIWDLLFSLFHELQK